VGAKLGGCAVGDIDPTHPGNEIVAVVSDGSVLCIRREGEAWISERIAKLEGEQIQCAVGDLLPGHPGLELVTVGVAQGGEGDGGQGVAWLFMRGATGWEQSRIFTDTALLHAVAIGELDADGEGDELVLAGFSQRAHLLVAGEDGFTATLLGQLPGNAKGAAVGAGGVVVACDDGTLVLFTEEEEAWTGRTLGSWPGSGLARVAAGEQGALVCSNDGRLRYRQLAQGGGATSTLEVLAVEDRLRGAVLGDLDPTHPGFEFASAGYDGNVYLTQLTELKGPSISGLTPFSANTHIIAHDDDRLHHLAFGELPGLGTCLVTCGYSGRVIVVGRNAVRQ